MPASVPPNWFLSLRLPAFPFSVSKWQLNPSRGPGWKLLSFSYPITQKPISKSCRICRQKYPESNPTSPCPSHQLSQGHCWDIPLAWPQLHGPHCGLFSTKRPKQCLENPDILCALCFSLTGNNARHTVGTQPILVKSLVFKVWSGELWGSTKSKLFS